MELLLVIYLFVIATYLIQSIIFFLGSKKNFTRLNAIEVPFASVIVCARNEEDNILRCLLSLEKLVYNENKLEIIIVNDNSTDMTGKIVEEFIIDKNKFKKIDLNIEQFELTGKANALATAIELAKGEIILTTDADCEVNSHWAETIASYFVDDVAIVNGYTTQESLSPWGGIQALDFVYLQSLAAGTINFDFIVSCIGNNMAFRKQIYYEVGGFKGIPKSVTEDLELLVAIDELKKYKMRYPLDLNALNISRPCKDINLLFRQKKRWAVGGLRVLKKGFFIFLSGYLANFFVLISLIIGNIQFLYISLVKVIIDLLFLLYIHKRLQILNKMKYFLPYELYYIIYVTLLPFIVLLNKKIIWKGRKYKEF